MKYIYIIFSYIYLDRILVIFLKGCRTSFMSHCVFYLHTDKDHIIQEVTLGFWEPFQRAGGPRLLTVFKA